jgi:hypothetical protein
VQDATNCELIEDIYRHTWAIIVIAVREKIDKTQLYADDCYSSTTGGNIFTLYHIPNYKMSNLNSLNP